MQRAIRAVDANLLGYPEGDKVLSSFREREYITLMAVSSPELKAFLVATPF
jgi:hypothetical protein